MADSSDGDSLFSFALFQEIIKDWVQLNIESDISISLVSSPCLSPLSTDIKKENEADENDTWWRDLKQHRNIAFSEIVGINLSFWQILLKLTISWRYFLRIWSTSLLGKRICKKINALKKNRSKMKTSFVWWNKIIIAYYFANYSVHFFYNSLDIKLALFSHVIPQVMYRDVILWHLFD